MTPSDPLDISIPHSPEPAVFVVDVAGDGPGVQNTPAMTSLNASVFKDVSVALRARLGQVTLTVAELLALRAGEILRLDASLNDLIELKLNDAVVARGELVAVGDNFGVRIVEIAQVR